MVERRKLLGFGLILLGLVTALGGWSQLTRTYSMLTTYGGGCDAYVLSEAGLPVEGATVTVLGVTIGDTYYDLNLPAGTTDGNGFQDFGISGDGTYRIKAERNSLTGVQEIYIGGGARSTVTLTLSEPTPSNGSGGSDGSGADATLLLMGGCIICLGVLLIADPEELRNLPI